VAAHQQQQQAAAAAHQQHLQQIQQQQVQQQQYAPAGLAPSTILEPSMLQQQSDGTMRLQAAVAQGVQLPVGRGSALLLACLACLLRHSTRSSPDTTAARLLSSVADAPLLPNMLHCCRCQFPGVGQPRCSMHLCWKAEWWGCPSS
jgi:hypothetical protein